MWSSGPGYLVRAPGDLVPSVSKLYAAKQLHSTPGNVKEFQSKGEGMVDGF
jgi:hypothetical protein